MENPPAAFRAALLIGVVCLAECLPQTTENPFAPAMEPTPSAARADGRLPSLAIPTHYELELDIDPKKPRFSGRATITAMVREPTSFLVLHARDLSLGSVEISTPALRPRVDGVFRRTTERLGVDELVLTFSEVLPKGEAVLRIAYDAPFRLDPYGLFRVQDDGRWYAFTNFEPTWARCMFPSFDEPGFKTPFDLTVTVPAPLVAFANMPEISRTTTAAGVRFRFATTPPLSTYLVALAVGEFDVERASSGPIPLRLLRTKGKPGDGREALDIASALLPVLQDDFGYRYPFPKLDLVAVPHLFHGAMENVGLITFEDSDLLLPDPVKISAWRRRARVATIAHELAHQWVGNLVTLSWWNDTWLNEGVATFFEARAVDRWRPSFAARTAQIDWTRRMMDYDTLPWASAVRQPVTTLQQATDVLEDDASRIKAAVFLSMLERFIGADAFSRGMRRYLGDHAWKSVDAGDLVTAMEQASNRPLASIAASFLDQPGVPEIEVREHCVAGRLQSLTVHQEPDRPIGTSDELSPRRWTIPFCASTVGASGLICQEIALDTTEIALPGEQPSCPIFIDPNPGLAGYYRYGVTQQQLELGAAAVDRIAPVAKIGLLSNAWATVERGRLLPDAVLEFLPALDEETDFALLDMLTFVLRRIEYFFVDDQNERAFRSYVAARMAHHKARLGLGKDTAEPVSRTSRSAEEEDTRILARSSVASMLAEIGDEDALASAQRMTRQWFDDPSGDLDPDMGDDAVPFATQRADASLFDRLVAEIDRPRGATTRELALRALGYLEEPALVQRALELTLRRDFSPHERWLILSGLARHKKTRRLAYEFVSSGWPLLTEQWRGSSMWPAWKIVRFICDKPHREALEKVFKPASVSRAEWFRSDAAMYIRDLDAAVTCDRLRRYGKGAVDRYFRIASGSKTP